MRAAPRVQRVVDERVAAENAVAPYLVVVKIPRCPHCFERGVITPNPDALDTCPKCGGPQPALTDHKIVKAKPTMALMIGDFMLWVGSVLRRLGNRLKGD